MSRVCVVLGTGSFDARPSDVRHCHTGLTRLRTHLTVAHVRRTSVRRSRSVVLYPVSVIRTFLGRSGHRGYNDFVVVYSNYPTSTSDKIGRKISAPPMPSPCMPQLQL
uniref:Uncharacterized protein n=1 Tax=Arundo donax TaxID=35708 RepID=A0A0A9A2G7_ARUDO